MLILIILALVIGFILGVIAEKNFKNKCFWRHDYKRVACYTGTGKRWGYIEIPVKYEFFKCQRCGKEKAVRTTNDGEVQKMDYTLAMSIVERNSA